MSEKIYNPHCTKWGNCQKRKENDCMGCLKNRRASQIVFNKSFEKMINGLSCLITVNESVSMMKFLEMIINEFVDLFDSGDLEDCRKYCDWMNGRGCPFKDDDEMTCIQHFKEYYIKNYLRK